MCNGTAEARMTAAPLVIFLAFKNILLKQLWMHTSPRAFLCSDAMQSQRTAESLVGYLRISFLTCWYQVPELKKGVVLLFGAKYTV